MELAVRSYIATQGDKLTAYGLAKAVAEYLSSIENPEEVEQEVHSALVDLETESQEDSEERDAHHANIDVEFAMEENSTLLPSSTMKGIWGAAGKL